MQRIIELNGNRFDMPFEMKNVQDLLKHLELADRIVIVELNREILSKDAYDRPVNERDQIEIIHFVGGG